MDESTDNSTKKNLILYLCHWDWEIFAPNECFIKLHEFLREPEGHDIAEIVLNMFINKYNFSQNQIISGATDGAGVMIGKHKGFIRYIGEFFPYLLANHCISHRLELSISDALKENEMYEIIDKLTKLIYAQLSRSFAYTQKLREQLIKLKQEYKKILKQCDTRWLSRHSSVLSMAYLLCWNYSQMIKIRDRGRYINYYEM